MWSMIRPLNTLVAGLTTLLGAALTGVPLWSLRAVAGMFVVMLFTAAGNLMNDLADLRADRINRPERSLPSGRVTPGRVRVGVVTGFVTGLLLACLAQLLPVALLAGSLLVAYNLDLQHRPLAGNIAVAVLSMLALIYAADLSMRSQLILPLIWIGTLHLSRELIKDLEDVPGDRRIGANTFPLHFGQRPTIGLAFALHVIFWGTLVLAGLQCGYPLGFSLTLLVVMVPADLISFLRVLQDASRTGVLQRVIKAELLLGFVALWVYALSH